MIDIVNFADAQEAEISFSFLTVLAVMTRHRHSPVEALNRRFDRSVYLQPYDCFDQW